MIGGCISAKTFQKMGELGISDDFDISTESSYANSTQDGAEDQKDVSQSSQERREILYRSIIGGDLSEDEQSSSQLSNQSSSDIELPVNASDERNGLCLV